MDLPEKIVVKASDAKPRRGRPTTVEQRRKSTPVQGKVKGKKDFYSDKEKMDACCKFALTGNSRRTAELTRIPEATIRAWKQTEWWNEITQRIHMEQDEALTTELTKVVEKAVEQINDRLVHGDYLYDAKKGELVRKPVGARDVSVILATSLDKRELLRGNPTSRSEKVSTDERLKSLAQQFKKFTQAKEIVQEPVEELSVEDLNPSPVKESVNELFTE